MYLSTKECDGSQIMTKPEVLVVQQGSACQLPRGRLDGAKSRHKPTSTRTA